MNKHDKITLQCADCDTKYKKTLKWLENAHAMECTQCHTDLDIDEVYHEVMSSEEPEAVFTLYPK